MTAVQIVIGRHIAQKTESDWSTLQLRLVDPSVNKNFGWNMHYSKVNEKVHPILIMFYKNVTLAGLIGMQQESGQLIRSYSSISHQVSHRACLLIDEASTQAMHKAIINSKLDIFTSTIKLQNLTQSELATIKSLFGEKNVVVTHTEIYPARTLELSSENTLIIKAKNQLLKRARPILSQLKLNDYYGKSLVKGLQAAFKIDEYSTKSLYHYNVFSDHNLRQFYLRLAKDPILSNNLCVHLLLLKSKPIAYEIGLREGDRYTDLERAYLADYSHYTPGKVMMVMLAESLAQQGIQLFDLGPGEDNLKRTLATQNELRYTVAISRSPLVRHLLVVKDKLRSYLYSAIFAHPRLYSLYRQAKQLI